MLHRGIKFAHAAVLTFSVIAAFLFVRELDESRVLGSVASVSIIDSDGSVSAAQFVRTVESFSAEHGIGIAREVPDLQNPERVRHLYIASGNPDSSTGAWLSDGYPEFSRDVETRVHPIADIEHLDPRGSYHVFGEPQNADMLAAEFQSLGLQSVVGHPLSYSTLATDYSGDPLFWSLCVVALAAVTLTGASVLLNARTYGVLRLQGRSFTDALIRDLKQLAVPWLLSLAGITTVTLAFLGFYNNFARVEVLASIAAVVAALLVLVVLGAHAASLALVFKVDVLPALKGELPSRAATLSLYVVRIPALLLSLTIALNATLAGQNLLTRQENREAYRTVGDAVSIRLSGSFATRLEELDRHVGPWLRDADERGEIIVAGRGDLQVAAPGANLPAGEIFIVNDTYLEEQPVFDEAGRRYTSGALSGKDPESRPVRIIVPEKFSPYVGTITKAVSEKLDPGNDRNLPLDTLSAKDGQRLFGYNTGATVYSSTHTSDEDRSWLVDPIVVVVPNGSNFLTNDSYSTFATQEGVIFSDPGDVLNAIEKDGLKDYISSISPIGQRTAQELKDEVGEFRLQLFNLIVAMAVLLFAGIGASIIYTRKNAQAIFARHVTGWKYIGNYRFILAVELAIAIVLVLQLPIQVWRQNRELDEFTSAGIPAPFPPIHITVMDLGVIISLGVLQFGAVLLALATFHRRIVKQGATGA